MRYDTPISNFLCIQSAAVVTHDRVNFYLFWITRTQDRSNEVESINPEYSKEYELRIGIIK